jgi:hypothetical protein
MNINLSDLNTFVSERRDSLKKLLVQPYNDDQTGVVDYRVHKDVIDKWYPVLGNFQSYTMLPAKYKTLMYLYAELISLFLLAKKTAQPMAWMTAYNSQHGIKFPPEFEMAMIEEAIAHLIGPNVRSGIASKCYNYLTGKFEYLLEDGNHVPTDLTSRPEMVIDDTRLPECVLMLINPQARRDSRIKQIDGQG